MPKLKKYSKYKEFENYVGIIPEDWGSDKLKVILQERNKKNKPIISKERLSLSIDKGVTLYAEKTTNLDRFKEDFTQYKIAYPKDLVLNSMNVIVGAAGVSKYFGCVSPAYYVLHSSDETKYLADYYSYFFKTSKMQKKLYSIGRGIMAIDRGNDRVNTCRLKVAKNDLKNLIFPIPSIKEQHKIVDFIKFKENQINKLINKQKKLIKLLQEKRKNIISNVILKGLDRTAPMKDSGVEYIGKVPQHWEIKKVRQILKQISKKKIYNGGIYIGMENIESWSGKYNTVLNANIEGTSNIFSKGQILFGKLRPYLAKCIITDCEGLCSSELLVLKPNKDQDVNFIQKVMLSKTFIDLVDASTYGAKMPRANWNFIRNIECAIPDITEQREIIKYINKIDEFINKSIQNKKLLIEKLEEYKKNLISFAVTGQIDVRDYEFSETDNIDLEEFENISEDDIEIISEVEYANN